MFGHWLDKGPGQTIEFMPAIDVARLAETLVAFANSDGGTIVFGVGPDGTLSDDLMADEVEDALRMALQRCRPGMRTDWQPGEVGGASIVGIRVPRSPELHALDDGRVMVRSAADNRPPGGDEIRQLAATKSSDEFELEPVTAATYDDLDPDTIAEYRAKRTERQRRPVVGDDETLLHQIGALTEADVPTVTGLLLFGYEPQMLLPQSGLIVVRFAGTDLRGPGGLPGYSRREEIVGPLPHLIEAAWQVITEEMRVAAVVKGLVREEKSEYPEGAVREALVNAVCHRDYQLTGRRIEPWTTSWRNTFHAIPGWCTGCSSGDILRSWDWASIA